MIKHTSYYDNTDDVSRIYSEKDKVPVSYVCSTEIKGSCCDVYYRDTPHPTFGNKYFGITYTKKGPFICDADEVENLEFDTVNGIYSRDRHDFRPTGAGAMIDGGRDYLRLVGDINQPVVTYKIKDGKFYEKE